MHYDMTRKKEEGRRRQPSERQSKTNVKGGKETFHLLFLLKIRPETSINQQLFNVLGRNLSDTKIVRIRWHKGLTFSPLWYPEIEIILRLK